MNLADRMRVNVQLHRNGFAKKQSKYLKSLYKEIESASKEGKHSITTLQTCYCSKDYWYTYDFYKNIPAIFEKEGFSVEEESTRAGLLTSWWRISW